MRRLRFKNFTRATGIKSFQLSSSLAFNIHITVQKKTRTWRYWQHLDFQIRFRKRFFLTRQRCCWMNFQGMSPSGSRNRNVLWAFNMAHFQVVAQDDTLGLWHLAHIFQVQKCWNIFCVVRKSILSLIAVKFFTNKCVSKCVPVHDLEAFLGVASRLMLTLPFGFRPCRAER